MPSSARQHMPLRPPGQRVAAAQPLAALPPYGCGVPLAGKAERAEGGTSGTLVTEILGAPQRETVKEKLVKCVLAPRRRRHPRRGNPPSSPHRTPPRPSGSYRNPAGTISRRLPYSAEVRRCRSAPKRLFLFHRARRILFLGKTKRAPAAPCAVGRGGAGERAQFSPQAETELSGLCDDDNGGRTPVGTAPAGAEPPRAVNNRPTTSSDSHTEGPIWVPFFHPSSIE